MWGDCGCWELFRIYVGVIVCGRWFLNRLGCCGLGWSDSVLGDSLSEGNGENGGRGRGGGIGCGGWLDLMKGWYLK